MSCLKIFETTWPGNWIFGFDDPARHEVMEAMLEYGLAYDREGQYRLKMTRRSWRETVDRLVDASRFELHNETNDNEKVNRLVDGSTQSIST